MGWWSLNLEICQLYLKKGVIFTTNINTMYPVMYNTDEFLARKPGVNTTTYYLDPKKIDSF